MRQVVGCDSESEVKTGCKNLTKRNVLVAHLRRKPSSERAELAILVHCKVPHIRIHIDVGLVSEGMQKCRNILTALFAFSTLIYMEYFYLKSQRRLIRAGAVETTTCHITFSTHIQTNNMQLFLLLLLRQPIFRTMIFPPSLASKTAQEA